MFLEYYLWNTDLKRYQLKTNEEIDKWFQYRDGIMFGSMISYNKDTNILTIWIKP